MFNSLQNDDYSIEKYIAHFIIFNQGIPANLVLMNHFYPGYIMRVYVNKKDFVDTDAWNSICRISCSPSSFLDVCDAENLPMFNAGQMHAMMWRFLPALDQQVGSLTL